MFSPANLQFAFFNFQFAILSGSLILIPAAASSAFPLITLGTWISTLPFALSTLSTLPTALSSRLHLCAGNQTQLSVSYDLLSRFQSVIDHGHVFDRGSSLHCTHLDRIVSLDDVHE